MDFVISYGATDPVFNDRIQFPSVYRTIPNEYHQFQVILKLLLYFNWTWIGIISTEDDSNIKAANELKQLLGYNGICVEFLVVMSMFKDVNKPFKVLKKSTSTVIILYTTSEAFIAMLQKMNIKELPSKVWISSISLNILLDLGFKKILSAFNGSLVITVHKEDIDEAIRKSCQMQLNIYLKYVRLQTTEEDLFFTPQGDVVNSFGILNWVLYPNGTEVKRHVGTFLPLQQFAINKTAIMWNPNFTEIPQSMCSEICTHGKRKSLQMGMMPCCFDCVPCSDGEIANVSGMENCIKCPETFWSNTNKTICIVKTIEYLSYDDNLGLALAAIAIIFAVASTLVMIIYAKHRNTAIVRANNQHLSYVLLIALTLSFVCSLLFIGHPTDITCLLRHSLFLFVFSVAISSVLGKTITVIFAFNAAKPGHMFIKWKGSRVSIGLTTVCCLVEFLICVTWTICAPPIVEFDSKTSHDKLILQCLDVSMFYFSLAISYVGFLALLSFFVAYSARKLPDNFNEAQHITFSMVIFCSVWLSFIPTYLSTKGKYTVAVEVFAILISTAGLLVCIFTPKCYVILLKPELNDKKHIKITKKNYKKY
ncbi:vomeronasal type-2 receptor 26-like [Ranitomeya variabilis]|uniref:vomeronasal type-2 receptor 26-like n=1 Tax=Ranitomeya variabilis TaxID=490064 RepID=UPI0040572A04